MKVRLLAVVCALALSLFVPASTVAAGAAPVYYLSLGDSLAAGTQPGHQFTDQSYTDQLFADLRARMPTLQHEKLGCPGETTATMISGALPYEGRSPSALCRYAHGSQLAEATAFLRGHRNFTILVTIDIGANDILNDPINGTAAIAANLPVILSALRGAAGSNVPVIGMNYYDPRLVLFVTDPAGLTAEVARAVAFNAFLSGIYGAAGDRVADVQAAFFTTITTPTATGIPLDVATICAWTWICTPSQNIHPNATGYHMIALAFEAKL